MSFVIAIAGKGGTGKTTVAALLVRLLKEKNKGSILAIDADPNTNLAEFFCINATESIGSIIDDIAKNPDIVPKGTPKDRFIEYRIQDAVIEADGFDILTMGRPEGPGCYCYANTLLRGIVTKLVNSYDYVVIDNEAGLEHLSRRTMRACDSLVIVSDHSAAGMRAAKRIYNLVKELDIKVGKVNLVINRSNTDISSDKIKDFIGRACLPAALSEAEALKWENLGNIPEDKELLSLSMKGSSLLELGKEAVSLKALEGIGDKIWRKN